jgi:hypothetical protein
MATTAALRKAIRDVRDSIKEAGAYLDDLNDEAGELTPEARTAALDHVLEAEQAAHGVEDHMRAALGIEENPDDDDDEQEAPEDDD